MQNILVALRHSLALVSVKPGIFPFAGHPLDTSTHPVFSLGSKKWGYDSCPADRNCCSENTKVNTCTLFLLPLLLLLPVSIAEDTFNGYLLAKIPDNPVKVHCSLGLERETCI